MFFCKKYCQLQDTATVLSGELPRARQRPKVLQKFAYGLQDAKVATGEFLCMGGNREETQKGRCPKVQQNNQMCKNLIIFLLN